MWESEVFSLRAAVIAVDAAERCTRGGMRTIRRPQPAYIHSTFLRLSRILVAKSSKLFQKILFKKKNRERIYIFEASASEASPAGTIAHSRLLLLLLLFFFRSRTRQPAQHTIMWLLESRLRTGLGALIQIRPGEANSWLKRLLLSAPNPHWAQLSPPSDTAVLQYADLCNCATWKNSRPSSYSTQSSLTRLNSF